MGNEEFRVGRFGATSKAVLHPATEAESALEKLCASWLIFFIFFNFFFYPFKFLLNVVQGFGLIGLDLNLNMHNVNIASNRTWVLLNVRHAPHQDFCLCSWQTRIASPDTSHAHTRPSAASLSMNPASRHWFTNPCCSSRRGQPRKGLCLFVLRET